MASGDVVNTAARLQARGARQRGRRGRDDLPRHSRGGRLRASPNPSRRRERRNPIRVWTAVAARARFGVDVAHEARTELVGRERELGVVRDAFERARHERTPQLLTLVGVPGIGKSRLVHELCAHRGCRTRSSSRGARDDASRTATGSRSGRWARSSRRRPVFSSRTRRGHRDEGPARSSKTRSQARATRRGSSPSPRAPRPRRRRAARRRSPKRGLRRLAPLPRGSRRAASARRRRRGHPLGGREPPRLPRRARRLGDGRPAARRRTARPELLERRPNWGGGKLNATTLALSPLSDEQTARADRAPLGRPLLAAEAQQTLLERAGGNPLYAEQFVELYSEQGSTEELPLPETLQGIIAARLDGLPDSEKSLLQDAAVVGKVFWASCDRTGPRCSDHVAPLTRAQGFRPPPAPLVTRRGERVRVRARARSRRLVRPDPTCRSRAEAPRRRRVDRRPRPS